MRGLTAELARRLSALEPEVIVGPLVEGAFVALQVAESLGCELAYAQRWPSDRPGLFPVAYRLPEPLRDLCAGRPVAIANDVVNAGSAIRGTVADLSEIGARLVGVGALLVLGEAAAELCSGWSVPLVALSREENRIWEPAECPLCLKGVPLTPHTGT